MDELFAIFTAARSRPPEPDQHARPYLWALILAVLMLMALAVAVLGPASEPIEPAPMVSGTPERDSRVYTVTYRFELFSPTNLRVHVGDTVRFLNDTNTPIHIIADPLPGKRTPEFDSVGSVQPDSYFSYTFATAGVFGYHTEADPNQAGVIIVRE